MLTHMLFQGMFFIITPALICGAFAERMKFSTMVVFMVLVGHLCLLPAGPLGVGWRSSGLWQRACQGVLGRRGVGFCRRDGSPHQFRRLGLGVRLGVGQTVGLRQRADAAAQPDLHRPGRGHALGGLVRIQRRQRPVGGPTGGVGVRGHAFRRCCGRRHLGRSGVEVPRQTQHFGRLLRPGGRPGLHHPGRRLRHPHAGPDDRASSARAVCYLPARGSRAISATTIRWTFSASTAWPARWGAISPGFSPRGPPGPP